MYPIRNGANYLRSRCLPCRQHKEKCKRHTHGILQMLLFIATDRIEKVEEATHVLVASNIKGHAISTVVVDSPFLPQGPACQGKLQFQLALWNIINLVSFRLKPHASESSGTEPAKEFQMQRIIKHFLGNVSFETSCLQEIADKLTRDDDQEKLDSDSSESHVDTPTDDYSIDTLSTSTMRMFWILCRVKAS